MVERPPELGDSKVIAKVHKGVDCVRDAKLVIVVKQGVIGLWKWRGEL